MDFVVNTELNIISIYKDGTEIMILKFIADEFCWIINTEEKIEISRGLNIDFYNALKIIMDNEYEFGYPDNLTYINNNQLCWYSDMYGDIEDELVTEKCSRLMIKIEYDNFKIWAEKPSDKKCGITKVFHCITFSPGGNGQMAKNIKTGCNFQDEVVIKLFIDIINKEKITKNNNIKKYILERNNYENNE